MFLHLPSLKALGFDLRTDVSMLLTIFLLSSLVPSSPIPINTVQLNMPSSVSGQILVRGALRYPSCCGAGWQQGSNASKGDSGLVAV